MPKGIPVTFTLDEVKEVLNESGGNIYVSAQTLGCSPRKLYDYVDEENLKEHVQNARNVDAKLIDDIALSSVERLMKKLEEEPSVALKAALSTLKRKGGTRKDWAEDDTAEAKYTLAELKELSKTGALSQE